MVSKLNGMCVSHSCVALVSRCVCGVGVTVVYSLSQVVSEMDDSICIMDSKDKGWRRDERALLLVATVVPVLVV